MSCIQSRGESVATLPTALGVGVGEGVGVEPCIQSRGESVATLPIAVGVGVGAVSCIQSRERGSVYYTLCSNPTHSSRVRSRGCVLHTE